MNRKKLIALALLLCCLSSAAAAQGKLGHLKSWAGKYPTERKGKATTKFFAAPEIRRPLVSLLSRRDYNLLTRTYTVEVPIKLLGNYLATKVCMQHACDSDNAGFVIDLRDGTVYVMLRAPRGVRRFSSRGEYTNLPADVLEYINDFSAN